LISGVDFGALRFTDYKRRTLHGNADEEHLKNEPQWFKSWMKILEAQSGPCDGFSQHILTYVSNPGFLEGQHSKKNRKALAELMTTDVAARLLRCSTSVLEEMISAIALQFAGRPCDPLAAQQMASLICLLRQARRTVLCDAPAQGPYIPRARDDWDLPPAVLRLGVRQTNGTLKTVVKRDGGDIVCTYTCTSGTERNSHTWIRKMSTLKHSYANELFRTWSYDTGEFIDGSISAPESSACWLIQSAENRRLRGISRQIETVLTSLGAHPRCAGLIATVNEARVDNQLEWKDRRLPWTYIRRLDQLIKQLSTAYREASVLDSHNPGVEIAGTMWPSGPSGHWGPESAQAPQTAHTQDPARHDDVSKIACSAPDAWDQVNSSRPFDSSEMKRFVPPQCNSRDSTPDA
jgi:hypothetical protein